MCVQLHEIVYNFQTRVTCLSQQLALMWKWAGVSLDQRRDGQYWLVGRLFYNLVSRYGSKSFCHYVVWGRQGITIVKRQGILHVDDGFCILILPQLSVTEASPQSTSHIMYSQIPGSDIAAYRNLVHSVSRVFHTAISFFIVLWNAPSYRSVVVVAYRPWRFLKCRWFVIRIRNVRMKQLVLNQCIEQNTI